MALFDHRVFHFNKEWWAAQVHSASGSGWGDEAPTMLRDTVYFSSLTDGEKHTVTASIPAGWLTKLSYNSLVGRLKAGKDLGTHFKMSAYNAPSVDELGPPVCTDSEGLRWVIRPTKTVLVNADRTAGTVDSAEFVCLDDSALRADVPLIGQTFDEFRRDGNQQLLGIVAQIKATFVEYGPNEYDFD